MRKGFKTEVLKPFQAPCEGDRSHASQGNYVALANQPAAKVQGLVAAASTAAAATTGASAASAAAAVRATETAIAAAA